VKNQLEDWRAQLGISLWGFGMDQENKLQQLANQSLRCFFGCVSGCHDFCSRRTIGFLLVTLWKLEWVMHLFYVPSVCSVYHWRLVRLAS
jgi:hypothetical protein